MNNHPLIYKKTDKIGTITFNRPEKKHAFDSSMWATLEETIGIIKNSLPRVLIITGSDEVFSAGFDVNPENPQVGGLIDSVMKKKIEPIKELINYIRGVTDSLTSIPIPIIAAINGKAYGGGAELAVRCDMRIADPNAEFCFSEVKLGLMPDWGGGVALTRLVGASKACELILSAKIIGANEALSMGMINQISEPGKSLEAALSLANMISENGPEAVRAALKVIRESGDLPLEEGLKLETEIASNLIASGECITGITAFFEGKKPEFKDI